MKQQALTLPLGRGSKTGSEPETITQSTKIGVMRLAGKDTKTTQKIEKTESSVMQNLKQENHTISTSEPLQNLSRENAPLMNSIMNSIRHLEQLAGNATNTQDPDSIKAIVSCHNAMQKMIKLGFDIHKMNKQ